MIQKKMYFQKIAVELIVGTFWPCKGLWECFFWPLNPISGIREACNLWQSAQIIMTSWQWWLQMTSNTQSWEFLLILQVSIPVLLFAKHKEASTKLILRGGTNTAFAPTIDYLEHVFAKNLSCMYAIELGVKVSTRIPLRWSLWINTTCTWAKNGYVLSISL